MTAKPRKPLLVNLTWAVGGLFVFATAYVLSYPLVLCYYEDDLTVRPAFGFFEPVELLMERSLSARTALRPWARQFDASSPLMKRAAIRRDLADRSAGP